VSHHIVGPIPDEVTIWDSPSMMHRALAVLETEQETTPAYLADRLGVKRQQASDTLRYLVWHGCAERVRVGTQKAPGSSVYRPAP
jgi:predicted ArsR family transcriptional regulator